MNRGPWHAAARACMQELWSGDDPWVIPWPCIHEFYAVVTNPKAYKPPASPRQAAEQIDVWRESEALVLPSEGFTHWSKLRELINSNLMVGSNIHDAKIAAICLQSGVTTLWTADSDYAMFPELRCENPLVRRK